MTSLHKKYGRDASKIMQGMILDQADAQALPDRFQIKYTQAGNSVFVVDTATGRRSQVALHALSNVRKVLNDLFQG